MASPGLLPGRGMAACRRIACAVCDDDASGGALGAPGLRLQGGIRGGLGAGMVVLWPVPLWHGCRRRCHCAGLAVAPAPGPRPTLREGAAARQEAVLDLRGAGQVCNVNGQTPRLWAYF